jgi:hypothetical protein
MIGRVRSPLIGASGHSALSFSFLTVTFDRRVRSVRILLSWQVTFELDCGVYKYIPFTSFRGLLLICSAEKHLSSARKCMSSSEGSDLRIKV